MMRKLLAILVALVLCLSFFAGCGANDKALAKIGDYKITQAYYNFIYSIVYSQWSQYEQYYGPEWLDSEIEEGMTIKEAMTDSARDQIEQLAVASIIAKDRYGITAKTVKEKVENQKKEIIESYGTRANFDAFLNEAHTNEKAIDTYLELYEIYDLLAEKISAEGEECYISDEEVEPEFNAEYGSKLKVQHILISTKGDGATTPERTDEEAMVIVNEVLGKLEKGADFDKLIGEYNEDPGMSPGNFYTFGDGEMVPEFEEASKNLQVGEYTKEAVKTDYGYHIIKKFPLDKTSEEFKQYKVYMVKTAKLMPIIDAEVEKQKISWDNEAIDEFVKSWLEEKNASENKTE